MNPIAREWWMHLARGVAAIVFGVLTLVVPGLGLLALVILWGAFALADGAAQLASFLRHAGPGRPRRWGDLAGGVLSVVAGLIAVAVPGVTAMALLYLIAAWALLNGVIAIVAALQLRRVIRNEWTLALAGVLSLVLGALLALFPGPGALAVTLWIGAFAVLSGVMHVALAVRLHARAKDQGHAPPRGAAAAGVH